MLGGYQICVVDKQIIWDLYAFMKLCTVHNVGWYCCFYNGVMLFKCVFWIKICTVIPVAKHN